MKLDFLKDWPKEWQKEVEEYLRGERKEFSFVPELKGTEFQVAVWGEMLKIPYGETRTYQQVAKNIGREKAVRAVGTACGANRYPVIVPCHRIVGKSGLGGYAFGLEMKKKLLALERQ